VECAGICNLKFEQGKPHFTKTGRPGEVIDADTIIFAIGQAPELTPFTGIANTGAGTIKVNRETLATDQPGIFAAGDAVNGPSSIIEAIASGRHAANAIESFLQGQVFRIHPVLPVNTADITIEVPTEIQKQPRQPILKRKVKERGGFNEVSLGLTRKRQSPKRSVV